MAYQRPMPQVSPWLAASEAVRSLFEQRRQEAIAQRQQDIENELNSRRVGVAEGGLGLGRDEFGLRGRIYDEGAGQRAADFAQTGAATDATIANTARTKQTTGFEADDRTRLLTALSMLPDEQTTAAPSPRLLGTLKTLGGPDFTTAAGRASIMTPGARGAEVGRAELSAFEGGGEEVAKRTAKIEGDQQARVAGIRAAASGGRVLGAERTALGYYNRMRDALGTVEPLEDEISKMGLGGQAALEYLPNIMQSQTGQSYRQAQRAFTEARLRKESGAAIPQNEYENDARTYFAQPGDTAATIQQKRMARQEVLDGIGFSAGNAFEEFYGEPFRRRAGEAGGAPTRRRLVRGPNGQLQFAR